MRKKFGLIGGLAILFFCPNLVWADCVDLTGFTGFYVEDLHTLIVYRQTQPLARINIPGCRMNSSSNILLVKSYVCDSDKLIIDGQECSILDITDLSASSFLSPPPWQNAQNKKDFLKIPLAMFSQLPEIRR
jgi:hypothetical protein